MDNKQKGILFSVLSALLFGLNLIAGKLLVDLTNTETMNTIWFFFASILFILLFVFSGKAKSFRIIIKNWKKVLLISFLATIGSLFWSYGIFLVGPNNVSFMIQFMTVFTVILGVIFLKERFTKLEGSGILVAIFGAFILTYKNSEISVLSTLVLIFAALFFSSANFLVKVFVKKIDPITLSGGRSIFIFLLTFSYALSTSKLNLNIPPVAFLYAFLGGLTGAFLGMTLFFKAIEKIKISNSMAIRTMEPFFTVVLSFLILSIMPTANQLVGGAIIVLGVVILILSKERKTSKNKKR